MIKEESTWKGRAQKIELLKTKLKKSKMGMTTSSSVMGGDDTLSVISETPSVFTGKITHAERNLTKMGGNRA